MMVWQHYVPIIFVGISNFNHSPQQGQKGAYTALLTIFSPEWIKALRLYFIYFFFCKERTISLYTQDFYIIGLLLMNQQTYQHRPFIQMFLRLRCFVRFILVSKSKKFKNHFHFGVAWFICFCINITENPWVYEMTTRVFNEKF